ncbi:MAG: hypothetical protein MZV70_17425, partial [Desulfobacterales bacterium]|nr:hypothetical protein [Desulfobacterales bacterium]
MIAMSNIFNRYGSIKSMKTDKEKNEAGDKPARNQQSENKLIRPELAELIKRQSFGLDENRPSRGKRRS